MYVGPARVARDEDDEPPLSPHVPLLYTLAAPTLQTPTPTLSGPLPDCTATTWVHAPASTSESS